MEETRKFVCKFCSKRFPSGKSLGGHIRTHLNQHSSNKTITANNPGKFGISNNGLMLQEKEEEGERFKLRLWPQRESQNDKERMWERIPFFEALCGHMACHSEKEKQKLAIMDSQSDTEASDLEDFKRTRFMTLNNNQSNLTSSSLSEVEQEEDDDDDGEVKNKNSVYNASQLVKVGKDKMKSKFSDSGCSRNGSKKEDSNISIDGVFRNDGFNRPKVEDEYGFKMIAKHENLSHNLDEVSCKKKKKSFPNDEDYNKDSYDSESYASAEKSTDTDSDSFPYSYQKPKSSKSSNTRPRRSDEKSKKTKEHECPICNKTFRSGQALGGHKRSHFIGDLKRTTTTPLE
ncbi:zinc finger protein ZAT1-like [Prosopis cineraria]|uniref:zinc finger protein ZAT1-like n=1 Tax=Prosopis cineraria TaxID=364024 RepID=UPI00240ED3B9|nr:zinc finger protein ZAT1-like [Prosopis cineraria]